MGALGFPNFTGLPLLSLLTIVVFVSSAQISPQGKSYTTTVRNVKSEQVKQGTSNIAVSTNTTNATITNNATGHTEGGDTNNRLISKLSLTEIKLVKEEKLLECANCASDQACESGVCYFGRCVLRAAPTSVRGCFQGFHLYDLNAPRGTECAACKSDVECMSTRCRFGRCVYGGVLTHLSMLTCFSDAYVTKCPSL